MLNTDQYYFPREGTDLEAPSPDDDASQDDEAPGALELSTKFV